MLFMSQNGGIPQSIRRFAPTGMIAVNTLPAKRSAPHRKHRKTEK